MIKNNVCNLTMMIVISAKKYMRVRFVDSSSNEGLKLIGRYGIPAYHRPGESHTSPHYRHAYLCHYKYEAT